MDLETENRIASILLKEAAELRRQAEQEGVHAYLRQPQVRGRPNSRFLTATVLGVQQSNRIEEVNEMWRVRQKEKELDDRIKGRVKDERREHRSQIETSDSSRSTSRRRHSHNDTNASSAPCSSVEMVAIQGPSREDEGLRDEEVETFLNSRVKRGRGAVGSRMDETGPYLPSEDSKGKLLDSGLGLREEWRNRVVHGPEKPPGFKASESSEDDDDESPRAREKKRKVSGGSSKRHSKRHSRSKEKSRDKKKKHKEEGNRCKYYK